MAENSKIEWTSHTFNPWRGCTKVSAGCANCYADAMSKRNPGTLGVWGPNGTRVVASEAMWREPLKWDKTAKIAMEEWRHDSADSEKPERPRVFCASLADVFEDWQGSMSDASGSRIVVDGHGSPIKDGGLVLGDRPMTMTDVRRRLYETINATPNLDWLLLTKRPENFRDMLPDRWLDIQWPHNVWLGTSVENQEAADKRIPELLKVPAAVRFLSVEPLLGPVDLSRFGWLGFWRSHCGCSPTSFADTAFKPQVIRCRRCGQPTRTEFVPGVRWVIVGGESGPDARTCRTELIESIRDQCKAAGVSCFVKQLGASVTTRLPDGERWAGGDGLTGPLDFSGDGFGNYHVRGLACKKGGDWSEWPAGLRVREFPK